MRVLVACECSGEVRSRLRENGHDAWSCDIQPPDDGSEFHIQGDALEQAYSGQWDMMIAFPPCTHLAVSGAKHFAAKRADGRQQEGIDFFLAIARAPIAHIAIENPVGIMSKVWRQPDQIIQPWQFGDSFQKTTCLWLKALPHLVPTKIVDKGEFWVSPDGTKRMPQWFSDNKSAKVRSKTFPGIAQAMADQWNVPRHYQMELCA